MELMEPRLRRLPLFSRRRYLRFLRSIKGKGGLFPSPKEKHAPPLKPKRIVIGSSIALVALTPKEGGSTLRDDDYIPLSASAPVWVLIEEAANPSS